MLNNARSFSLPWPIVLLRQKVLDEFQFTKLTFSGGYGNRQGAEHPQRSTDIAENIVQLVFSNICSLVVALPSTISDWYTIPFQCFQD